MGTNPASSRTRQRVAASTLAWAVGLAIFPAAAVNHYLAVPLGTLGGATSCGNGINASGQVTGASYTVGLENYHGFLYSDGAMIDLGVLSIPHPLYSVHSSGAAINDRGQVAGTSATGAPNGYSAFLYSGSEMINLGFADGIPATFGHGINGQGIVVGTLYPEVGRSRAVLLADGTMVDLGTLGGANSESRGVNSHRQVTGWADLPDGRGTHAFLWSDGVMNDIGTLAGGADSFGHAISARGHIAGDALLPNIGRRAFLFAGGRTIDLGATLGGRTIESSVGWGINNRDDVVGFAFVAGDTPPPDWFQPGPRAFLFSRGKLYDLNELVVSDLGGKRLSDATGINDRGQIAANSRPSGFLIHCTAYRLDPVLIAVEYRNAEFDHYFVTTDEHEIETLDTGAHTGWTRTGETFLVYPLDTPGTANVCRYWSGQTFAPASTHLYTPFPWQCSGDSGKPGWVFEGDVFAMGLPVFTGACRIGTIPLYRLYNDGQGGVPNYRYTTSATSRSDMLAQGWTSAGFGPSGVIGCVAQP
jgi:probable HAF family extracellular repeat protein